MSFSPPCPLPAAAVCDSAAAAPARAASAGLLRSALAGLALLAPAAVTALTLTGGGAVVTTPQVRAELVAHAPEGLQPGRAIELGLLIEHQPKWHTYWKNPGDSGLPTTLAWTLPAGFAPGEIAWPTPQRLPLGPLMNFGYEGRLLLPVQVQVPADFSAATLEVKLRADWLVCKDVCIPEGGDFTLSIPASAATAGHAAAFAASRASLPQPVDAAAAQAGAAIEGDTLVLRASALPAAWQGRPLAFFPETPGIIANAAPQPGTWSAPGAWSVRIPLDPQRSESPAALPAVLALADAPGGTAGVQLAFQVSTPWPAARVPAAAPALGDAVVTLPAVSPTGEGLAGFALALAFALVGGLLLNLMPCVFPVLSLKVMGFAGHAHERGKLLAGGLAYTAGVVLSFVALAALLLALRAGGEQLGWGFQLQQPGFVAALALLFTLIGLNLAGVFEVGSVLPGSWAAARARHPLADHFLTGVLAVAVASPCTAPFMGASLGAAMVMPTAQALAVFAALGLGMALPYLAASASPRVAGRLPRPGAWMATLRNALAFPMFATVVWLVWVLGQQAGIDGVGALLGLLVAVAFAAWAWGSPGMGRRARQGWGLAALALLAATLAWALPALREAPPAVASGGAGVVAKTEDGWEAWSPARAQELLAQGRPMFVDFTAAWCVTCQVNKRTTLADERVLADFRARNVALLRADWTRRDPAITAELARLGRSGVPVYALYAPGAAAPQVLSELLSVAEVQQALAALPPAAPAS